MIKKIEQFGDQKLTKVLFEQLIGCQRDYICLDDLPKLDYESFIDICRHVFSQKEILKVSIDTLIKIMTNKDMFVRQGTTEFKKAEIRNDILRRLCEFILRICLDNEITVVKSVDPSEDKNKKDVKETQVILLSCQEKIQYCQFVIDQIQ